MQWFKSHDLSFRSFVFFFFNMAVKTFFVPSIHIPAQKEGIQSLF